MFCNLLILLLVFSLLWESLSVYRVKVLMLINYAVIKSCYDVAGNHSVRGSNL